MTTFNDGEQNRELNQYWYSENTIKTLCEEIKLYGHKVAFLSTPSLYFAFPEEERKNFKLFEYDKKWEKDPGFVFYDFNEPEKIPVSLWNSFDYIVADPPFITEEVWVKYIAAITTLGKRKAATSEVESQHDFKCLLTTVLENHGMLENHLDCALFIPDFRPTVNGLVYQYNCFVNYPHISFVPTEAHPEGRGVGRMNREIPPEDPKIRSGRMMANDLRESETEFLAQMRTRNREGEQKLPTAAHEKESAKNNNKVDVGLGDDNSGDSKPIAAGTIYERKAITDNTPIEEMKWGHIPEGLQMYKDGASAPSTSETTEEIPPETYGEVYVCTLKKRETLDAFKKSVDESFKKLDVLLNLAEAKGAESEQVQKSQKEFNQLVESIATTIHKAYSDLCDKEQQVTGAASIDKKDATLLELMKKFVTKLSEAAKSLSKDEVKEVAIDATRNYKSPAFNRQKELLQLLKAEKKKYNDAQKAKASS